MPRLYIKGIRDDDRLDNRRSFRFALRLRSSGRFLKTVHLVVSLFIVYLLHQLYGEVSFYTKGRHRFVEICGNIWAKKAKFFGMLYDTRLLLFFLAHLRHNGEEIFLTRFTSLFNGHTVKFMTLLFFAPGGLMALLKYEPNRRN